MKRLTVTLALLVLLSVPAFGATSVNADNTASIVPQGPTNLGTIPITLQFDGTPLPFVGVKDFTGAVPADIVLVNATLSNFTSVDIYYNWTFDISPVAEGLFSVNIPAGAALAVDNDLPNTAGPTLSWTYDITAPGVTLTSGVGATTASAFSVTATFTEVVTGLLDTEIVVVNGTVSNFVDVSGDVYTFDVTPGVAGAVTVDIPALTLLVLTRPLLLPQLHLRDRRILLRFQ